MRDLILFMCCCLLGVAFWAAGQRLNTSSRQTERQQELYQVGAPQDMSPSPERALLMGDFVLGLRSQPGPETYAKLAELFLVSNGLRNGPILAHAFNEDFMARVMDKTLQFFDVEGRPLSAKLWNLDQDLRPWTQDFVAASKSVSLRAEGSWIVYRDPKLWLVCRHEGELVSAYLTSSDVTVEGDVLTIGEKQRWAWRDGKLELEP